MPGSFSAQPWQRGADDWGRLLQLPKPFLLPPPALIGWGAEAAFWCLSRAGRARPSPGFRELKDPEWVGLDLPEAVQRGLLGRGLVRDLVGARPATRLGARHPVSGPTSGTPSHSADSLPFLCQTCRNYGRNRLETASRGTPA